MNNSYQVFESNNEPQYVSASTKREDQPKPNGLNLFSIPLFNIYNPRSSQVSFTINTQTNDLTIMMVPAIPNNAATTTRGPVPSGTKVYDYSKKVNSAIGHVELIDLVTFLKDRLYKNLDMCSSMILDNNNSINEIKNIILSISQYQQSSQFTPQMTELLKNMSTKLDTIINQNNQILSKVNNVAQQSNNNQYNNENTFSMYRSDKNGSKSWMFVYDPQMNKLHINVVVKNNFNPIKISSTLSIDMAKKLLNALEGFLNNFSTNSLLTNFSLQLSETLGNNKIVAPVPERKYNN